MNNKIRLYFDMDGTIADLYAVENWLPKLRNEDVSPYEDAKPLVNMIELVQLLQNNHIETNIISWTSKGGSKQYNKKVRYAKLRWLRKYNLTPSIISKYHIVDYGTPKSTVINKSLNGFDILIDDESNNQLEWLAAGGSIIGVENLIEELKKVLDFMGKM